MKGLQKPQTLNVSNLKKYVKNTQKYLAEISSNSDPEVVKEAVKQFPKYAEVITSNLSTYFDSVNKELESADKSTRIVMEELQKQLKVLRQKQNSPEFINGSFEYQDMIRQDLDKYMTKLSEENSKYHMYLIKRGAINAGAVIATGALTVVALGGKVAIPIGKKIIRK